MILLLHKCNLLFNLHCLPLISHHVYSLGLLPLLPSSIQLPISLAFALLIPAVLVLVVWFLAYVAELLTTIATFISIMVIALTYLDLLVNGPGIKMV